MELTVLILNWNAADDTVRCVQQIATWQQLHPTILVVDNASSDGSREAITQACPDVKLLCNQVNGGFAGGNNLGIKHALASGSSAPLLLLNNDAQIGERDAIRLLQSLHENSQIGLIGPLLYDAQHKDRLLSAGSRDPALHHHSHIYHLPASGLIQIVECVPGTVILIRDQVFRTLGLLDEDYFFGSEIADLCLQARQHNILSAIDTRSKAFHHIERSLNFRSALYPYYIIRNRFLLIRKFHRKWRALLYAFWALYSLALACRVRIGRQRATARAIYFGLVDGLKGRFGGQNERILRQVRGER
ncbi:MAG: glycosyltransferase family 2 protein [Anaerolineae bacterium]|nr:glycosyltransferase family 2 protein [Anaerolineae bacterium]